MAAYPAEAYAVGSALVFVSAGVLLRRLRVWRQARRRVPRARHRTAPPAGHAQVQPLVWQNPSYVDPDFTRIVRRGDMPTAVIPRQRDGRRG